MQHVQLRRHMDRLNSGIQELFIFFKSLESRSGMAKVKSVGASTAVQVSLDMKQIMRAVDWQRLSTLQRRYFKPQDFSVFIQHFICSKLISSIADIVYFLSYYENICLNVASMS